MCSVWTVIHFMTLCIAGVHLLTFARIHYAQLFGLPPNYLCGMAWVVGFAVSLPSITNSHIVIYDPVLRHCVGDLSFFRPNEFLSFFQPFISNYVEPFLAY